MSDNDNEKTLLERVELCEQGLTAIETILRSTFPQFFEPIGGCEDGHKETVSGAAEGPGETGKETSGEETGQEKGSEETPQET